MDFAAHYADMLAHYTELGMRPDTKDYAWHRVKQMAAECPELYASLPEQVKQAVLSAKVVKSD